jgi:sigma-B regulation protein RsbU (phosphoserine phosphatase)
MKKWIPVILFFTTLLFLYAVLQSKLIVIPFLADQVKEWLIGIGFVYLLYKLTRRSWFERLNLIRKLHAFGIGLLVISVCALILPISGNWHFEKIKAIYTMGATFVHAALALGILGFLIYLFLLLKELIFIHQQRRTEKHFRLLLLAVFLNLGFMLLSGPEKKIHLPGPLAFESPNVFYVLLIIVSVIHGFRCKWIYYLNKRSKIVLFFVGLLIYGFFISQAGRLADFLRPVSFSTETLASSFTLVFSIYIGMALCGILIHLPSAGFMDRKMREVRSFQDLSVMLSADLKQEALVAKIPVLAAQMTEADLSWLELIEGNAFKIASMHIREGVTLEVPPESQWAACRQEALEHKKTLLLNDLAKCKSSEVPLSASSFSGSLLVAPVASQSKVMGVLYAMKSVPFGFVEESQGLFQAFTNQAAISLNNVQLVELSIKQEKAEEELRLAHQAQMRLLPQTMPAIRGFDVEGLCVTANEIGGDFFDVIPVQTNRLDIVIGDVSGKGATAAFYMAEFKGVIQALVSHFDSPKDILVEMNAFLRKHCDPDTFLTMVYAILQQSRKRIRLARAGHCPVGLIRGKKVEWIETKGLGLGLSPEKIFRQRLEEIEITFRPNDILFFYTDGLTEARNPAGEEFGEDRLSGILSELHGSDARALVRSIAGRVEEFTEGFPRHDDVTMLALRSVPLKKSKKGLRRGFHGTF